MNHVIIKIESGIVADVYFPEPINVTIVDHDATECGDAHDTRLKKAALSMTPDQQIRHEDINQVVEALVLECRRPGEQHAAIASCHSDTSPESCVTIAPIFARPYRLVCYRCATVQKIVAPAGTAERLGVR